MRFDYLQDHCNENCSRGDGIRVIPILENCVDEFERVANNEGQLNLFSAYRRCQLVLI